jgi:hypothetical protein
MTAAQEIDIPSLSYRKMLVAICPLDGGGPVEARKLVSMRRFKHLSADCCHTVIQMKKLVATNEGWVYGDIVVNIDQDVTFCDYCTLIPCSR